MNRKEVETNHSEYSAAKRQDGDVGGACHRCGQYPMRWWGAWGRYICGSWWHMEGGCSWD